MAEAGSPVMGATYRLADEDYKYGRGPLLARITRVIAPIEFGEAGTCTLWWQVEAMCRHPNMVGPGQRRELYIRAGQLPAG